MGYYSLCDESVEEIKKQLAAPNNQMLYFLYRIGFVSPESKMTSKYVHPGEKKNKSSNSALASYCTMCGPALDIRAAVETQERRNNADTFTADVLAEVMKRMPDLLSKIIAEQGGIDR